MKKLLNKKGFTIVELVIVIAVIAILAAVLIPTFSNVIQSANDTAAMSEAESTLKAYVGYMGTNKQTLSDGPVFKVDDYSFVYYKGQLHQFDSKSEYTVGAKKESGDNDEAKNPRNADLGPVVTVGDTKYACNKYFTTFIKDNKNENPSVSSYKYATFFYVDNKIITFVNGSEKCNIYPGVVVYHNEENLKTEAANPDTNYAKMLKGKQIKVNFDEKVFEADSHIAVSNSNELYSGEKIRVKIKETTPQANYYLNITTTTDGSTSVITAIESSKVDKDGYVEFTIVQAYKVSSIEIDKVSKATSSGSTGD